jgi:hypothetical protein
LTDGYVGLSIEVNNCVSWMLPKVECMSRAY